MLATRAAEWKQQWLLEGEQKGRLEGEQKGEAKVLLRLLERRFGSVPDATKDRIAAADVSELDTWIVRVLGRREHRGRFVLTPGRLPASATKPQHPAQREKPKKERTGYGARVAMLA